jgi:hypothetical protein
MSPPIAALENLELDEEELMEPLPLPVPLPLLV